MATQTTNLGLTKPGYDEAADVVPAVNNNMDAIDAAMGAVPANTSVQAQITANAQAIAKLDESIAIVSNGNTHAAIAAGQYVYIKGHGTLAEGLYTANSAISANATLSNSNVTAVSGGGLNALNSNLENVKMHRERVTFTVTTGNATIHFPGSGTANMGVVDKDIRQYIPTGGILVAMIPGQTVRDYGQDYAFVTLSDANTYTVRVIGSPNKEYTCNCDILYRMY